MDTKIARRDLHGPVRASVGQYRPQTARSRTPSGKVCAFWLAGNCRRHPCRFLHSETAAPVGYVKPSKHSGPKESQIIVRKQLSVIRKREEEEPSNLQPNQKARLEKADEGCDYDLSRHKVRPCSTSTTACDGNTEKNVLKICDYWVRGNCVYGEKCMYLHSWSYGAGFSMLTQLEGHKKAVTGITLPTGSDKLYTGNEDGTVRVWNCHTGECVRVVNMGAAVGCLISEGPWVFVGKSNALKAWNVETNDDLSFTTQGGQVHAMAVADGKLFVGVNDGSVLVWKPNPEICSFELAATLKGHTKAVVSLVVGANRLYSGSMDNSIRVWDLETLKCLHMLDTHSGSVMSMVCWDRYLLSGSLDHTLKIWAANEEGELNVIYTHNEEHGILALCGIHDTEGKPILLCSCKDKSVRLYELPSFAERGRIFARQEVRTIHAGPGGLFFTGDGTGRLSVWKI